MDDSEREFEDDVRRRLHAGVAGMPEAYEPSPDLVRRARRHRGARLTAVVATVLVVAAGTSTGVAQVLTHQSTRRLAVAAKQSAPTTVAIAVPSSSVPTTAVTSTSAASVPTRPSVSTVACPATYAIQGDSRPPPSTAPRVPAAGDASVLAHLASFAGTTDPRFVVLGPRAWSCQMQIATDGDNALVVYPPDAPSAAAPDIYAAPVAIENDFLWHGLSGTSAACAVSTYSAVLAKAAQFSAPCAVPAGRILTRVDSHVTTFVDAGGDRGMSWIVMPLTPDGSDGRLSILTCRPTAGLTTADCDAIVADFAARLDGDQSASPTSVAPAEPSVPTAACPLVLAGPSAPGPTGSRGPRTPATGDRAILAGMASYAATSAQKYIVLGPSGWSCAAQMYEDGRGSVVLFDPANGATPPAADKAPVAIENDWLWHGGVGSVTACSVFDAPAVVQYVTRHFPTNLPCPRAGRTVTGIDSHLSTFVDAGGARGAGWLVLPSAQGADGFVSVLTCRPTAGLTTADCETIVADFVARIIGRS